jgi:hypothetical protein
MSYMKQAALTLLLVLFNYMHAHSQNATGKWIWQSADGPSNTWMCFRKSFYLNDKPEIALTSIAVDSKYWLWINDSMVVFEGGLKRGPTPEDTYVDTINISPYLHEGKNTVALLVWYFGKNGYSHNDSKKGGLFFQCFLNDTIIATDSTWKMIRHPAFEQSARTYPDSRLPESDIRYNAQNDTLGNWQSTDYDDSSWPQAVEKGAPPVAPWNNLWKRPVPQWKNSGLKDYESLSVDLPYTTTEPTKIAGQLPYNAQITPYMEIISPAGQTINIYTDDARWVSNCPVTVYITKEGTQEFESLGWMNGHSVQYGLPAGITVKSMKYRETGYNTEFSGSFACNDTFFNVLWQKAQRTLYVCMRDNYMDCPDRERACWWGDAVNESGQAFYAFDQNVDLLTKKSIIELMEWQKDNGIFFSPIPSGNWDSEYPMQMLPAAGRYGVWNYFLHTADTQIIEFACPRIKQYLDLWLFDQEGLIEHRNGMSGWTDWGVNIDRGIIENCWFYMALQASRDMAIVTKRYSDTVSINDKINSIKENFNRIFWNGSEYRSPQYSSMTDERANALAVVAGLADSTKWPAIRRILINNLNASPYMEKYVLEALFIMGYENDALARMKHASRYAPMVYDTLTTLYERFGNQGTYNHGWSGGPLTLLSQYCAGVAPDMPGFSMYHLFPAEGNLQHINANIPSVKGNILVEIDKDTNQYSLFHYSPENTEARVGIPRLPFNNKTPEYIYVNGQLIWHDGKYIENTENISFNSVNNKYIIFNVKPGTYNYIAMLKDTAVITKIPEIYADNELIIYPNPAKDFINIVQNGLSDGEIVINIYDIHGKQLISCTSLTSESLINISNLQKGVYFISVKSLHKAKTYKVIIQ